MTLFLISLPTAVLFLFVLGISLLLSIGGLLLVRRIVPVAILEMHNDVAGFIFATLGVTYAVILAFMAIVVWEEFAEAQQGMEEEASTILNIFRDAAVYPETVRQAIRRQVQEYARTVIEDEWPLMARGQTSPQADEAVDRLFQAHFLIDPRSERESNWHKESLERLNALQRAREFRLGQVKYGLPPIVWGVLIFGAAITVAYTFLYGVQNLWGHILMTSALTATLAVILVLMLALNHPFAGETAIGKAVLEEAVQEMRLLEN